MARITKVLIFKRSISRQYPYGVINGNDNEKVRPKKKIELCTDIKPTQTSYLIISTETNNYQGSG